MKAELAMDGRTIKSLRVFNGYSQRELAEASGLKPWRIKLESGVASR